MGTICQPSLHCTWYHAEMEIAAVAFLSFFAGIVGTVTGFGTATIMVPVLLLSYSLPETLLLSGVVHWFGNFWKVSLFWEGVRWRLILLFALPGVLCTWIGASLIFVIPEEVFLRTLGLLLIIYTMYMVLNSSFKIPTSNGAAIVGGSLSGFTCGMFGIGGAIRSAFLSSFDLPKATYLTTLGIIGLFIDSARLLTYWSEGIRLISLPYWSLFVFIGASLLGALVAKQIVDHLPQQIFRTVIMLFLFLVAVRIVFIY